MASRKRHREDGDDGLELAEEGPTEEGMPPVTKKPFAGELSIGETSKCTSTVDANEQFVRSLK